MSGRFVRASKFRHVLGDAARKEATFSELRPQTAGENSNYIAANAKFFAMALQGGGGPLIVHPLNDPKRFPAKFPVINVHKGKVLDMDFNPFYNTLVATAGEDGLVKVTKFPDEGLVDNINDETVCLSGHQKRVGITKFHPTADNILMSSGYDNTVKLWDIEAQQEKLSFDGHPDLIQSAAFNRNGSLIVTTCKDRNFRVYDPRAPEAAGTYEGLDGGKAAKAIFLEPNGYLAMCGFGKNNSRKIVLYDLKNYSTKVSELDLDQSAGVLCPFWDEDTSILYVAGKGDGTIRYFEITADAPNIHHLADFRSSTPHKGVGFAPKLACDYMKCEIALALRVMRDSVEPVRFTVPRKSDLFQDDLFPPTYAGEAALSAAEWLGGENKEPVVKPIQEAAANAGAATKAFVAKKSPAELEKELAEALARIAELEAELAKHK